MSSDLWRMTKDIRARFLSDEREEADGPGQRRMVCAELRFAICWRFSASRAVSRPSVVSGPSPRCRFARARSDGGRTSTKSLRNKLCCPGPDETYSARPRISHIKLILKNGTVASISCTLLVSSFLRAKSFNEVAEAVFVSSGAVNNEALSSRNSDLEVACTSDHLLLAALHRPMALLDRNANSRPVTVEREAITRCDAHSRSFQSESKSHAASVSRLAGRYSASSEERARLGHVGACSEMLIRFTRISKNSQMRARSVGCQVSRSCAIQFVVGGRIVFKCSAILVQITSYSHREPLIGNRSDWDNGSLAGMREGDAGRGGERK